MSGPPPDKSGTGRHANDPTAREIERVASAFDAYTRQQEAAATKAAKHNRKIRRWTRGAAVGALAYTVITALVLVASVRGIQEARRATHYASNAVAAASRQADIVADTERRQLRAYVFIESLGIAREGNILHGHLTAKNSGQTPAYNFSVRSALYIEKRSEPFHPNKPLDTTAFSRGILGPQSIFSGDVGGPLPPEYPGELAGLTDGDLVIYYYGRAEYTDAFDRIWTLDFRARNSNVSDSKWTMQPTEEGNRETQKR